MATDLAFFADETPAQIAAAIANQEAITGWTVRALVHTYDPEVADTPEFVAEIDRATGVWFGGVRRNAQVLCSSVATLSRCVLLLSKAVVGHRGASGGSRTPTSAPQRRQHSSACCSAAGSSAAPQPALPSRGMS